jgi:isopentenyl-diphosphate delta-isomerase type 1
MTPMPDPRPTVVLLDERGRPCGARDKSTVHDAFTPFHLAFSCYVVDEESRVLITRRALHKRTWPGVWTNACCGHPRPGETLRQAVARHLAHELGVRPNRVAMAIPDFAYRAEMTDGTVEHELCPVVVASVSGALTPNPDEVADVAWLDWGQLTQRALESPESLSPWSVEQIRQLVRLVGSPHARLGVRDPVDALVDALPGHRSWGDGDRIDTVEFIRRNVDRHLAEFVSRRGEDVPEGSDAIDVLNAAIASLASAGGKRLRPAFLLWGHVAGGGTVGDAAAMHAAAAVELLHTFALIHDDVMDRSHARRGRPTAHTALAADRGGRLRDPSWFGICAAILAGDLAHVWADTMFDRIDDERIDRRAAHAARRLFTTLRTEVIAGQYLDLSVGCDPFADEFDATRIALLKSARYTATRPLQIGAALAGGSQDLLQLLAQYGDAAGIAFQLRDDVLGVFGDRALTGKSAADDLREGKRTLLVLRAMRLATAAGRRTLERALGCDSLDELDAARCRDVIASSGALASVEAAIDMHLERAVATARMLESPASGALTHLALQAARREH